MKKTLALGMAAAMTATLLAGCGGSSSSAASSAAASTAESTASSTAAASTAESTGSYTDYSAGFPENVTIQIPVYDRGFENWNPTDNYYTRWIQSEFGDKYNVTVKYVAIARSNEVQDFNQMIAAGNAPTIIFHYDMPAAVNYWSEGAEQPIDLDEVAYYAPTYWDNMKDTIETYGKLDGENAFIFAERDPIYYNWVTLIRKDWLDQVGLDVPTSNEELKTAMQAFKDAGLGVENAPLITKSFTYFYNWIPEGTSDDELAQYLDLNVAPFTWTATKNYLQDMNEKYNAGIVDPEFYLTTDDTLAKAENVMVLDLHTWAMALMQQDGLETAKRWFYPGDYTHTNDFGAYKMAGFVAHALGDALGLMVTDAPEWTPTPPFVPLEAPADCAIPAPEGDPFADYDATRPNDTLTRAEALELAIKALKLFPINVYNDLYSDIVGHETYAGTIQCAAQNDLIPPEWVADGSLYPNQTVTAADFLAVLIPGAAGRRPLADAVPVPDSVPVYARRAVGQAVAEGLIAPEALTKPLNRSNAAEICRRLHI